MNRRQNYRFSFPTGERPRVEVVLRQLPQRAQLLDLGVQGMRVRLSESPAPPALDEAVTVRLELPRLAAPVVVSGTVVYLERMGRALDCGVRFLPLPRLADNEERDRVLWAYLMEEQRRHHKKWAGSRSRLRLYTGG